MQSPGGLVHSLELRMLRIKGGWQDIGSLFFLLKELQRRGLSWAGSVVATCWQWQPVATPVKTVTGCWGMEGCHIPPILSQSYPVLPTQSYSWAKRPWHSAHWCLEYWVIDTLLKEHHWSRRRHHTTVHAYQTSWHSATLMLWWQWKKVAACACRIKTKEI